MNNEIGSKIKKIRKQQKMTQAELGLLVGKKEVTIRKYENGSIEVPLNVLHDIAKSLNTSIANLIGIDTTKVIYSPELGAVARELNTHYEYVTGATTDKILTRYDFNETLKLFSFNRFEKNTNHFSLETQVAIYGMLDNYFSTALRDWFFMDKPISSYELNNLFLISLIIKKIEDYKEYLINHLIENDPVNPSNYILRKPTPDDLITFANKKTDLLNSISKLLDGFMSVSFDISGEFQFEEELKLFFGDKYFKQSNSKSNTDTD